MKRENTTFEPPSWLNRTAKAYWRSVAPALKDAGILNVASQELIATACHAYGVYRECADQLAKEGRVITTHTGAKKLHPLCAVERNAFTQICRVFKALGLGDKKITDPQDDLSEFLEKTND